MSSTYIDHTIEARARVATQYTESAKFLRTLAAVAILCQDIEDALLSLKEISDIDLAHGVQLDVIGDIVGVSRVVPYSLIRQFFGFNKGISLPFGEENAINIGGRFREELELDTDVSFLEDDFYRLLIKSKIIKNHSIGTNEDILLSLKILFPECNVVISDQGGMAIQISIGKNLSFVEKTLLSIIDILPRPSGVQISQFLSYSDKCFGFFETINSLPFGEESDPTVGGIFSEEFR